MTITEPQPSTLDPKTLNEEFVQEVMGWMEPKSSNELKTILSETNHQPHAYAPEMIEAVQRILSDRQELAYTPTKGERTDPITVKHLEVQRPNGEIQTFPSIQELREAIIEGRVKKEWLIREYVGTKGELSKAEARPEQPWEPILSFAKHHVSLETLYAPQELFLRLGFWCGTLLGYFLQAFPFFSEHQLHDSSPPFDLMFFMLLPKTLLWLLPNRFLVGPKAKSDILIEIYFFLCIFTFVGVIDFLTSPLLLEDWCLLVIHHIFWITGFLIVGGALGGPLGLMIGSGIGYVRSEYFPIAQDAEPEGMTLYRIGIIYPAIFMLITWPLFYFWLYPWFLSILPTPVGL